MNLWIFWIFSILLMPTLSGIQVSGLTYLDTFNPGESKQVRITLLSDKDKPELVEFKLSDYCCNSEGQHFFEDAGQHARSNTGWIKQSSYREVVQPGERRDIYLTVSVPNDNTLIGSYWSVLLIEPSDPVQTLTEAENGFQLHVKVRYAFHIVTNIGEGTPALKITKKEISHLNGIPYFTVNVLNTGNIFLNPKMTLKLFSKQGKLEKTLETQTERLYPNSSSRFLANGEGLPDGKYTAFLLLDNGDGRLFGDTFELSIP